MGGGYGLGLAICRDLVMAINGGKGDDRPTTSAAWDDAIDLPPEDKVASAIAFLRANHAALIASVTVHVVTVQTELGRWVGDVGAIWGFEVVVSATAEAAIGRTLPGVPSAMYIDAALVTSDGIDIDEMRVDLPAGMPVVLLHSIHDAAVAQSLCESTDETLSTPLCEEKLLGSLVGAVPVLADAVPYPRTVELVSLANPMAISLSDSASSFRMGPSGHRRCCDESARDVGSLEASAEILSSSSSLGTLSAGDDDLEIGDLRALVVEDDPLNLMVIKKLLSMSGVTSIDVASNGAEGAEAIMSGSYSFVLTDMHMPVMSGVEMVRTVQARAADNAAARAALDCAYVVFLSGSVMSPSDLADMEAAGVRDTLQKPVLRSDLVRVLEGARKLACDLTNST